ncbi:MAG: NAD(P)/FAD-dependent oxidoreductase [Gammaproteobacteria bacterium]|jgi:cyclohexanone monooxygenase|nr:NAD(P)/FAD-dependent oxidoreductase [Gammaproteobacteria bacterium]MBT3867426.1 NAD(P)/FAD-dependent oxidoreductase [Gammaproteobacteria bacterium]MBT5196412.1 NAD(P)/FAD-dependent oxidoreductase [Gammaproteobacteria bacterium]MBT5443751.1 NAD(P)/FAD-dependent oxidoreductase [Gammaproteobacteria bacterium]MBT5789013.1 NAD(P)/FAD-dependent oxidoreductase [Gammaproteobacteria bacterium]
MSDSAAELVFDPDALRERYRVERDKRLREDANEQYVEMTGTFAHYLEDPYVDEKTERKPVTDEVDVVLIGGGFGGLQAGARLRDAGIKDIKIIEKGGAFGGTWYWNRYPGAQCDIEAYCYLPLLEELNYVPKEKYAFAREILDHSEAIGQHFDLHDCALFQTEVTELRWDESIERWIVSTNRGDAIKARFVSMANGPLHRPKLPGIPGVRDFKGHTFHTSRWDYDYTGGGPDGGLDKLSDKKIAIIGTGATAIQCVPFLGEAAEHLYVFQRTPSTVDVRGNSPTDPAWAEGLQPGWQKHRMENFNSMISGVPQEEDLVNDGWTDLIGKMINQFQNAKADSNMSLEQMIEMANFEKMEEIRARVDELVEDDDVAEKLKPYYKMFCKRPTFNDDYLPTFNRSNVTLVDTDGQGVERITEKGLMVDGVEYEVDCIIYSTGFEVGTSYTRRSGYDVIGREAKSLSDHWRDGTRSLHGMGSHGFPNVFIMNTSQGGFTANFPHLLDESAVHQAHIIAHALVQGYNTVEVTATAEEEWIDTIVGFTGGPLGGLGGPDCTPGYYNNEGQPNPNAQQSAPYGGGSIRFFELLKEWREDGNFEGLTFK